MARQRNKELETKLLRLFQDEKLKSKDDLLTLFCKRLGYEHAETKLPSRGTDYWGDADRSTARTGSNTILPVWLWPGPAIGVSAKMTLPNTD